MLGDELERAFAAVGMTAERVEAWLGRDCGCSQRKEKLNQLHAWVKATAKMAPRKALGFLRRLLT